MILENALNFIERIAVALERIANTPTIQPSEPTVEEKITKSAPKPKPKTLDYTKASHDEIVEHISNLEQPSLSDIRQFQKSVRHVNRANGVIIIAKATNAVGAKRLDEILEDRYQEFVLTVMSELHNAE